MTSPHWTERAEVKDERKNEKEEKDKKENEKEDKKKQFVFVTTKGLPTKDQVRLARNFQTIVVYNPHLMGTDISKIAFDALILDANKAEDHAFLEINKKKIEEMESFVLKKRWTNWKDLAASIGATPLRKIPDLVGDAFLMMLGREKLPQLSSRFWAVLQACFQPGGQ